VTWDTELEDLATTTVTYTAATTMDAWGAPSTGTSVTITARIEQDNRLVRDQAGREVVSSVTLHLKPTTTTGGSYTPRLGGTFTLPSGYVPLEPPIISVRRVDDALSEGGGVHHFEVSL
jgi:hypothetical protein